MTRSIHCDVRVTSVPDMSSDCIRDIREAVTVIIQNPWIAVKKITDKTYIFSIAGQMDGEKTLMDLMQSVDDNFPMHRYAAIQTDTHTVRSGRGIEYEQMRIKNFKDRVKFSAHRVDSIYGFIQDEFCNEETGLTSSDLSQKIPQEIVSELMKGDFLVTQDIAEVLAQGLGTTPELWLNLQDARSEYLGRPECLR